MRRTLRHVVLALWSALLIAAPLRGHHKKNEVFYDTTAPVITLKGTISRVDWSNPHVFIYVAVTDSSGKSQEWSLEGDAPSVLMRLGWAQDSLKPGDNVTVQGFRPRTSTSLLALGFARIQLPGGRTLQLLESEPTTQTRGQ